MQPSAGDKPDRMQSQEKHNPIYYAQVKTDKVCSKEQFDNILSILIETPIPCTNMPELERKISLVRMSMFVPKEVSGSTKMEIIKILRNQFGLSLNQTKEYVDSCIGRYNVLPKAVTQAEIDKVIEKLEPYNVIVSTAVFY